MGTGAEMEREKKWEETVAPILTATDLVDVERKGERSAGGLV